MTTNLFARAPTIKLSDLAQKELSKEQIAEAAHHVSALSFPQNDDGAPSTFSGYLYVGGKQIFWSWKRNNQALNDKILLALREEKEFNQSLASRLNQRRMSCPSLK